MTRTNRDVVTIFTDAHEMPVGKRYGVSVGLRASGEVAEACRDALKVQTW